MLQVGLIKQVEEGGIGRPAPEIQPQRLVQLLPGAVRKGLLSTDIQNCHQQQEPLRVAHPAAVATIRDRFEVADKIDRYILIDCGEMGCGH